MYASSDRKREKHFIFIEWITKNITKKKYMCNEMNFVLFI